MKRFVQAYGCKNHQVPLGSTDPLHIAACMDPGGWVLFYNNNFNTPGHPLQGKPSFEQSLFQRFSRHWNNHDLGDLGSILQGGEKDDIEFLCVCDETGQFDGQKALDLGFDHPIIAVRFHGIADSDAYTIDRKFYEVPSEVKDMVPILYRPCSHQDVLNLWKSGSSLVGDRYVQKGIQLSPVSMCVSRGLSLGFAEDSECQWEILYKADHSLFPSWKISYRGAPTVFQGIPNNCIWRIIYWTVKNPHWAKGQSGDHNDWEGVVVFDSELDG